MKATAPLLRKRTPPFHLQHNTHHIIQSTNPEFSSGPCKTHPGYSISNLPAASLRRYHNSKLERERLKFAIDKTKRMLNIPNDYLVGIVPASDTGVYKMAMWWESFGKGWFTDTIFHMKLRDTVDGAHGELPDLSQISKNHDIYFTFNGTTSGVRVQDGCDWIVDNCTGPTLCDATSAFFAMHMPCEKLDVTMYLQLVEVPGGRGSVRHAHPVAAKG